MERFDSFSCIDEGLHGVNGSRNVLVVIVLDAFGVEACIKLPFSNVPSDTGNFRTVEYASSVITIHGGILDDEADVLVTVAKVDDRRNVLRTRSSIRHILVQFGDACPLINLSLVGAGTKLVTIGGIHLDIGRVVNDGGTRTTNVLEPEFVDRSLQSYLQVVITGTGVLKLGRVKTL